MIISVTIYILLFHWLNNFSLVILYVNLQKR